MADEKGSGAVRDDTADSLDRLLADVARTPPETPSLPGVGDRLGRFELVAPLGRGGFGVVYEAVDQELGRRVAVKVLSCRSDLEREVHLRLFRQEAQSAARLNHPNIVTIHDVGTHGSVPYLVLERLEGRTLAERLARGPLPPDQAMDIAAQAARGLVHAHAAGVIHRDIKPSNVFLCEDGRVKILDFGLARALRGDEEAPARPREGRPSSGAGTPAYMAPEQWRGDLEDARSDLFSLGVVLHECLTGKLPFPLTDGGRAEAPDGAGPAPLPPSVSPELAAVVGRCLCPRPEDRFQSARELLRALLACGRSPAQEAVAAARGAAAEGRVASVVVAGASAEALGAIAAALAPFGARVVQASRDALVAIVEARGPASDRAAQAARAALALRRLLRAAPVAVATGHGTWPSVVDQVAARAARLLGLAAGSGVRVDDVTAGLIGSRFEVGGDEAGLELRGERAVAEAARTVLGRRTPFVGRQPEIQLLEAVFAESTEEPAARAVLVSGPSGIGKSRLVGELLGSIRARGEGVEVWTGSGHPLRAGAAFGLVGGAVREAANIADGEPLDVRQQKLQARLARHAADDAEAVRFCAFLGELAGVPFPPARDPALRAAQQDPALRGDQIRLAFERWLRAECAARPVVLLLEDLQWGDLPSVRLLDAALEALADRPLLLVAVARPEVHGVFPHLWGARGLREVRLGELSPKASTRLCRSVLGPGAGADRVERVVALSGGNPFLLEELLRAAAERREGEPPGSVLAVVHARIDELGAVTRRVLCGASVFGETFWPGGLRALAGVEDVWASLAELRDRELVVQRAASRFPGEQEHGFRHALVRDAAYALLGHDERVRGHRLAAEWLEVAGEPEPLLLAEHWERAERPERAVPWYARAARQALDASDLGQVLACAERAVACGAAGALLGSLRGWQAEAHVWRGEHELGAARGSEALRLLPRGSEGWYGAAGAALEAGGKLGHRDDLIALGEELLVQRPAPSERGAFAVAASRAAVQLFFTGEHALAERLVARLAPMRDALFARDPAVAAWIDQASSVRALYFGDLGAYVRLKASAAEAFGRAGDRRNACAQRGKLGYGYLQAGAFADAERTLRQVLREAEEMGLGQLAAVARHNLGLALTHAGALEEGRRMEESAASDFAAQGDRRLESAARKYLAMNHLAAGRVADAEREARAALAVVLPGSPGHAYALAVLARVHVAAGRPADALAAAREGMELLQALRGMDEGEATVRLAWAEALQAAGDSATAAQVAVSMRDWLLDRARRISDPTLARSFLEQVPENRRGLDLAGARRIS